MFVETKKEDETQQGYPKPSLAGLVAWLETKDPNETYQWETCQGHCLIGQYLHSVGIEWQWMVTHNPGLYHELTPNALAGRLPHTFGAALERARALTPT